MSIFIRSRSNSLNNDDGGIPKEDIIARLKSDSENTTYLVSIVDDDVDGDLCSTPPPTGESNTPPPLKRPSAPKVDLLDKLNGYRFKDSFKKLCGAFLNKYWLIPYEEGTVLVVIHTVRDELLPKIRTFFKEK